MERSGEHVDDGGQPVHNPRLIRAGGVIDAVGCAWAPGVVLLEGRLVRAVGSPQSVGDVPGADVEDRSGDLLMPGLVNAHVHLDLSGPGPWPRAGSDFRGWVGQVRTLRSGQGDAELRAAVDRGIALSLAGGTSIVGDIAGMPHRPVLEQLRASALRGVAFAEFFGLGDRQAATIEAIRGLGALGDCEGGIELGISPHAAYSCGPEVFRAAARSGRPLATHLAETRAECELLEHGTGPLRAMLEEDIGVWSDAVHVPGCHPVEAIAPILAGTGALCAHLNWIEPNHARVLAEAGISVVYCPRASAAFGHAPPSLPVHPCQALIEAGVRVCLGTDSLLCLDTPERISILDEMRLMHRRDDVQGMDLLRMATIDGAAALGVDMSLVTFESEAAGIIACRADGDAPLALLDDVLARDDAPSWILPPGGTS